MKNKLSLIFIILCILIALSPSIYAESACIEKEGVIQGALIEKQIIDKFRADVKEILKTEISDPQKIDELVEQIIKEEFAEVHSRLSLEILSEVERTEFKEGEIIGTIGEDLVPPAVEEIVEETVALEAKEKSEKALKKLQIEGLSSITLEGLISNENIPLGIILGEGGFAIVRDITAALENPAYKKRLLAIKASHLDPTPKTLGEKVQENEKKSISELEQ